MAVESGPDIQETERIPSAPPAGPAATEPFDFPAILNQYESPLLRYVRNLLDHGDGEDIVQETFIRLLHQVKDRGIGSIDNLSVWLFRVAHNLAIDAARNQNRDRRAKEALAKEVHRVEGKVVEGVIQSEAEAIAMAELQLLPENQRQAILLRFIQGFALKDMSELLGAPISTLTYRLNQGLSSLAHRLKEAERC
ncbi:MAG: RNA polymerase sigma factor [Planctomycetota bacterium]|jgi:RNA polymerase sigma-70 factor (ECF subfamily)